MLADNGIRDVRVISVAGQLTDHTTRLTKQWILARRYTIKAMQLRQLL
jgi:Zn-dependent membrane protease YugP